MFSDQYRNRRVFLTGHTGFKGSWMALWLSRLGAQVSGYALDPETTPSHWTLLDLEMEDQRGDIRDAHQVQQAMEAAQPEIVFHLAAQPLVRRSYADPLETWSTNVVGTATVLEACRAVGSVRAIVVITTDKVYDNREWLWGYRETDPLGGHDAYSASKACTEIVVDSYRKAFFTDPHAPLVATARAGNVIGGGDWSQDRLIPDLVRAATSGRKLEIRSPEATRPWQHVLETLSGYLRLGQLLLGGRKDIAEAWNFGPETADNRKVRDVLAQLQSYWPDLDWFHTADAHPHEANLLYLDSAKSRAQLDWQPVWTLDQALEHTAHWYQAYYQDQSLLSAAQLDAYIAAAKALRVAWTL